MGQEIELKFELERDDIPLLHKLELLQSVPGRTEQQLTVYYDTPKESIRKHGFSLRVRSTDGGFVQTAKPLAASAALFARDEWEWPVQSIEPELEPLRETPLGELVQEGRLKKLVPAIRSEVSRTSWRIDRGGSAISVDLDEGEMAANGSTDRFTELELELVGGPQANLIEAARTVVACVPVRLGVLSKAERGFALADGSLGKVTKAGPVAVRPDSTVAEGMTVIVQACLKHFRRNEPLVVSERKPEALHQARVAMRRLRSAFSMFKPVAADEEYELLRQELRWFTNLLGDARNLDVFLQRDDLEERPDDLLRRREEAYDEIIAALGSARFRKLMFDLVAWLAAGGWRDGKRARKPLLPFAGKRLDRMWRRVTGVGDLAAMDDHARHELRIEVKKLRYGVEFFSALYPEAAATHKRFAKAVEELQETLGQLNDIVTAQAIVGELETVGDEPEPLLQENPVKELVGQAERAFRQLRQVGPYWTA